VPLRLLDDAVAGVDEDHGDVGRRRAGDRVAGVLHVAGGVGEHERALGRGEVAVGDVDGDALFAFGPQAVDEQREIRPLVAAALARGLDRGELVGQDRLRIVEQAADERGLAVVDRTGGDDAQQLTWH
jgi:hypothetical protein